MKAVELGVILARGGSGPPHAGASISIREDRELIKNGRPSPWPVQAIKSYVGPLVVRKMHPSWVWFLFYMGWGPI